VGAESVSVLDGRTRARFHSMTVSEVLPETADALTLAVTIPEELAKLFRYRPGQFVTVRVAIDGEVHLRSYSMCSTPEIDPDLRITVKRVPGGLVSNWLNDHLRAGDSVEVTPPAGTFVVPEAAGDLVAYAAGSGITPVLSIIKSTLASSRRRFSLLYANHDRPSTIFAQRIEELGERYPDRFRVVHHHDLDSGFITPAEVAEFVASAHGDHHFVCGPEGFMETVEQLLQASGVNPGNIHIERFTPSDAPEPDPPAPPAAGGSSIDHEITIRSGKSKVTVSHRPGTTILQTARFADLRVPSSCEAGSCATCMARVTVGEVRMRNNEALTLEEVAEGWVLTCQAEPVTPSVTVIYE
jgi:3-ketosteroid 9alpha-monooxygenase subunit B